MLIRTSGDVAIPSDGLWLDGWGIIVGRGECADDETPSVVLWPCERSTPEMLADCGEMGISYTAVYPRIARRLWTRRKKLWRNRPSSRSG